MEVIDQAEEDENLASFSTVGKLIVYVVTYQTPDVSLRISFNLAIAALVSGVHATCSLDEWFPYPCLLRM